MAKTDEKETTWAADASVTVDTIVDSILKEIAGFTVKINKEQGLSVVDLKHRQEAQGVKFRQIFVTRTGGSLTVALVETFKSTFGGTEAKRTLNTFTVSVSNLEAFTKLENRFFNYNNERNLEEAKFFLTELETTLR